MHLAILVFLLQAPPNDPPRFQAAPQEGFSVGIHARVSTLGGNAGHQNLDYGDLHHSGYGIEAEGDYLWRSGSWAYGLYGSLGYDHFAGRAFTDDVGDTIDADPLDVATLGAGGRIDLVVRDKFLGDHSIMMGTFLGGGGAYYAATEGDLVVGGTPFNGREIYGASAAPFVETGFRFGVTGNRAGFTLGLRVRVLGGPDRGDDVTSVVDPGNAVQVAFEVGWDFRF